MGDTMWLMSVTEAKWNGLVLCWPVRDPTQTDNSYYIAILYNTPKGMDQPHSVIDTEVSGSRLSDGRVYQPSEYGNKLHSHMQTNRVLAWSKWIGLLVMAGPESVINMIEVHETLWKRRGTERQTHRKMIVQWKKSVGDSSYSLTSSVVFSTWPHSPFLYHHFFLNFCKSPYSRSSNTASETRSLKQDGILNRVYWICQFTLL